MEKADPEFLEGGGGALIINICVYFISIETNW